MKQQSVVKLIFAVAASCALAAGVTVPTLWAQAAGKGPGVPIFEADPSWPPKLPNNWNWGVPTWVAVDRHDNVWVLHRPRMGPADLRTNPAPAVVEFDKNGKFVNAWGAPGTGYDWPDTEHGIFVDYKDRVWITGINPNAGREVSTRVDDMILKFTNKGQFLQQIGGRDFGGRQLQRGEPRRQYAVGFFGERLAKVAGAQPRFDMSDGQAAIECSERAAKSCSGVALHHHQVGRLLGEHRIEGGHNAGCGLSQSLPGTHHVEIVIRRNRKGPQGLIEQTPVLRRYDDASFEFVGDFQEPARHRRQLDRLGTRAQDDRDFQGADFIEFRGLSKD